MPSRSREIPWLTCRDNGVFYVNWYEPATRRTCRKSLGTRNAGEARARFAAALTEGIAPRATAPGLGATVAEVLDRYLEEHADRRCRAPERQRFAAARLKQILGPLPLRDVDIPTCRDYAAERGVSPDTVRRELGVLNAAARHSLRWRRISAEDLPSIELPPSATVERRFLSPDEVFRVFAVAEKHDPEIADFAKLAYFTAARRSRIERLTVGQCDVVGRRITLRPPGERETKKRAPVVPMNPVVLEICRRRILATPNQFLFGRPNFDARKRYQKVVLLAGLDGDQKNPHLLRHSRATHLRQSGVLAQAVADLLGDTLATVERVYGHRCPDFVERVTSEYDDEICKRLLRG